MTEDEAMTVAAICSTADGGCSVCVTSLAEYLKMKFPDAGFGWSAAVGRITVNGNVCEDAFDWDEPEERWND